MLNSEEYDRHRRGARPRRGVSGVPAVSELLGLDRLLPTFVVGRSGVGKHAVVVAHIADYLARGKSVLVLDCGMSYLGMAATLGGSAVSLLPDGRHVAVAGGTAPFAVIDFATLDDAPWEDGLPELPGMAALVPDGLVVVDETHFVRRLFPSLPEFLRVHAERGVGFCLTGQHEDDIAPFLGLPPPYRRVDLSLAA